jgi:hypothetical protein
VPLSYEPARLMSSSYMSLTSGGETISCHCGIINDLAYSAVRNDCSNRKFFPLRAKCPRIVSIVCGSEAPK